MFREKSPLPSNDVLQTPPKVDRHRRPSFSGSSRRISQADLAVIADLMKAGKVTPVIERQYPMSETTEALRYLEEGHARAKIVIKID